MNKLDALWRFRLLWWVDEWVTFALLAGSVYWIWGPGVAKWVALGGALVSICGLALAPHVWLPKIDLAGDRRS